MLCCLRQPQQENDLGLFSYGTEQHKKRPHWVEVGMQIEAAAKLAGSVVLYSGCAWFYYIELNFVVWVYFMLGISCSRFFVVVLADRTERTEWMRHHHLTCLYIAPRLGQVLFETVWDCCMSKVWWQTSHRRSLFQQRHMYTLYVNVCGLMCKCIYGMDVMSLERSERSRPVRGILSFSAKVYGKHTINVFTCKKKQYKYI